MALRPITLGVKRGRFRRDDSRSGAADKAFATVRKQVLERDDHTCQFCGFRAAKWQEVHHVNDDHHDNSLSNLVTACPLCHQAHHIGLAGAEESGVLVHLPGIGQAELNVMVRSLWMAESGQDPAMQIHGVSLLSRLNRGKIRAQRMLGTSNPAILGNYLLELDDAHYARRGEALEGLLLLPVRSGFTRQIKYWQGSVYKGVPPTTWVKVAQSHAELFAG